MTGMDWSDQYDASAADHVTPEKVKSWIQQNGPYPSIWDDPTGKGYSIGQVSIALNVILILQHLANYLIAASTNPMPSPSGTASPSSSATSGSSNSSSSNNAARSPAAWSAN